MNLHDHINRCPRPYDAQKGTDAAARFPDVPRQTAELIAGVAGCSPYLASLIEKEADWLPEALGDVPLAVKKELATTGALAPDVLANGLRRGKRRVALISALADLAGAWSLEEVTGALTVFADGACQVALRAAVLHQIRRKKLPGMTEDDAQDAAGMVVLAMGKMGAGELNYSSDIDLICLFDETRFDGADFHDARAAFIRATRAMASTLSDITSHGYVFRTDLRLRPDPSVTPVCIAMDAAEQYYESLGRTWERAAYIKARAAAGDLAVGRRFLETLTPFVWRRHLDFAAIQDAHDMRLAIREHKGLGGPITLPEHNMKLGRGGIREIEFFTQTRQLIAGGRDKDLRCRGTIPGLQMLAQKGWVDAPVAAALQENYSFHRTVEHRLQMVRDAQTHNLPRSEAEFDRLAAMMDRNVEGLRQELGTRLAAVHDMTEGFFAPGKPAEMNGDLELDDEIVTRWARYPALRSARSRQIFERVKPDLLSRLSKAARPQEALLAFDGFLSGLPAGVQLFSLLEANPQLTDLIIDVADTSPALAQYLARNAGVFDAVIGGDFFTDWPGQAGLQTHLSAVFEAEADYERQLDAVRRWHKEWHFRIGVHLLRGLVTAAEASTQYADLARAVLCGLWPRVIGQFSLKHGAPPGRGAIVLGLGSLGAATLNPTSDLDLIVIYDPLDVEQSDGKKSLFTRTYYARLTQALITALSAPMAQGKLFEVDMRLRPSGNQGPVATSWPSFQSYQREQAWLWEHLALTRAAVMAGPQDLAQDFHQFQSDLLKSHRQIKNVAQNVAEMRTRLQGAKQAGGLWDVKTGAGRLQEIELMAQAGLLLAGGKDASTGEGLLGATSAGLLTPQDAEKLANSAALFSGVYVSVRLLSGTTLAEDSLGLSAQNFLVRTSGQTSFAALEELLTQRYRQCSEILDRSLAAFCEGKE